MGHIRRVLITQMDFFFLHIDGLKIESLTKYLSGLSGPRPIRLDQFIVGEFNLSNFNIW
jgi:hypothetical protein